MPTNRLEITSDVNVQSPVVLQLIFWNPGRGMQIRCLVKCKTGSTQVCFSLIKPITLNLYKKWEKATVVGVFLVANALEHLERTTTNKEVKHDPVTPCECLIVISIFLKRLIF